VLETPPNKGVELTAYSVRYAPASSRSSRLAFGFRSSKEAMQYALVMTASS
jgi:hypothetical protein